jgi:hypothetical protein
MSEASLHQMLQEIYTSYSNLLSQQHFMTYFKDYNQEII